MNNTHNIHSKDIEDDEILLACYIHEEIFFLFYTHTISHTYTDRTLALSL